MTRWARALIGLCLVLPAGLAAQQPLAPANTPVPPTPVRRQATVSLTLAEAMEQARRNSPAYRQFLNDATPAGWGVRNAYANLLPTFDVSSYMSYTGSGSSTFGGSTFNQSSPSLSSGYSLNFNWQLSGQVLAATGQQRASRKAVDADISNAGELLRNDIAFQYLTALQAVATTEVDRQSVQRNADFLGLARARYTVGQNTMLDVRQAEVTKGQADVALLKAQQAENEAKLELFRRMGIPIPAEPELVALPDSFPVTPIVLDEKQLLDMARDENPRSRRSGPARTPRAGLPARPSRAFCRPSASRRGCRDLPSSSPTRTCCSTSGWATPSATRKTAAFRTRSSPPFPAASSTGSPTAASSATATRSPTWTRPAWRWTRRSRTRS